MSNLEEFVAIGQMVMRYVNVSSLLIIITTVVIASCNSRPLLGIGSHKVDVWIGVNL